MIYAKRGALQIRHGWVVLFAVLAAVALALAVLEPANAAGSTIVEAESMSRAGKVIADKAASNDRGRAFFNNGTALKDFRGSIARVAVRARGDLCKGAPRMVVKVDGRQVMSRLVKSKTWKSYETTFRAADGAHRAKITFTNNHRKAKSCDRNLYADKVSMSKPATVAAPTARSIALGTAVVGGYPNYPLNTRPLNDFVSMTGKTPAVVNWFQDWSGGFVREYFEDVSRRGATPMVTWEPKNYSRSGSAVNQPDYALRTIIAGKHDTYIRNYARESAAWGKPMYMRFAHEMNGDWYPWAAGVNGNTSAEYVAAWRHVHDIFRQEGATNVRWVWAPNHAFSGTTPFAELYPGDAYVDWVGIDGYNWGGSGWTSFADIFGPSYRTLAQMTNKPMMIAETASAEAGGDKAAWIRQALLKDVPYNFPRVKAVLWFNIDLERDWHVNSSPKSLIAYKEVVSSPLYQGRLP